MTGGLQVDVDVRANEAPAFVCDPAFTERVLDAAAQWLGVSGEVSVSFVDDSEIHELNRTYRDVDRPTDVLSFPMDDGDTGTVPLLGDIVVSIQTALRQAAEYGHSPERETGFLLVHGFLHLTGFDHDTKEHELEMFRLQDEVLEHIGLRR